MRFHAIYWPAFLLSAGLPLPKSVFCHGFVMDAAGCKMSKTLGNVIDADEMLRKFGADSFRYFCVKDASPGADLKFSETALLLAHNSELADGFGNLVHRGAALALTKCDGKVPALDAAATRSVVSAAGLPFDLAATRAQCRDCAARFDLAGYAQTVMAAQRAANKWITDLEPWKMKDAAKFPERDATLRLLLEACYALALFFAPLTPHATPEWKA